MQLPSFLSQFSQILSCDLGGNNVIEVTKHEATWNDGKEPVRLFTGTIYIYIYIEGVQCDFVQLTISINSLSERDATNLVLSMWSRLWDTKHW